MKITAKYLTKVYPNGTYALDDFSAEIESGEFVAVLGESGCGKTTLLRLLSGLEKPTAGELYLDGVLYSDIPMSKRDTAVVFQEYVLYPKMTVWENVAAALERYGLSREEEERRVFEVLSDFGLIKLRNQLPRVLSGGQQQRVALARAVVRKPSLILFDEPLSNIAKEQRDGYLQLIIKLKEKLPSSTFIYVTHNPAEAMTVGKKLLIMGGGRLLQYGDKERVWKNPYCADVLRTICAQTRELCGTFKNGIFTSESRNIPFDGVEYEGAATVIFNEYNNMTPHIFDGGEEALAGEKRLCFFEGTFDGKNLVFGSVNYAADEDFRLRFIGEFGTIFVGVESTKLKVAKAFGDIAIPAKKRGGNYEIFGKNYCIYGVRNFDGYFYVNPADIALYSGGERVLAHYRNYKLSCSAKAGAGKLKLACGTLAYDGAVCGRAEVSFKNAYIRPVKKGGLKAECVAEEYTGTKKLVYILLKGFKTYLIFRAAQKDKFFIKKLKIQIDGEGIVVNRPLR